MEISYIIFYLRYIILTSVKLSRYIQILRSLLLLTLVLYSSCYYKVNNYNGSYCKAIIISEINKTIWDNTTLCGKKWKNKCLTRNMKPNEENSHLLSHSPVNDFSTWHRRAKKDGHAQSQHSCNTLWHCLYPPPASSVYTNKYSLHIQYLTVSIWRMSLRPSVRLSLSVTTLPDVCTRLPS